MRAASATLHIDWARRGGERALEGSAEVPDARLVLLESSNRNMQRAIATARQAAASDLPVLLVGESGTGKSTLAAAIHRWSPRRDGPFVRLPCTTLASESPTTRRIPRWRSPTPRHVRAASRGTLFLDDVGEMPLDLQAELSRVIAEDDLPHGDATTPTRADVRIVAASLRDLEAGVHAGRFRQDLFFRLNVVTIVLPPLRERREDVAFLVDRLLEQVVKRHGGRPFVVAPEVCRALVEYDWPGNAREMVNVLERAVVLAPRNTITTSELPDRMLWRPAATSRSPHASLQDLERLHIRRALDEAPTLREAAAVLGINPSTLWRKRKRWGLE
jgi:two-component system, NtrC family, response regulator AlgB